MSNDRTEVGTVDARTIGTVVDDSARPTEGTANVSADRYKVLNRLGKGGMGEVMQVRDEVIGREVALKRIRRAAPSDRLIARFLREATIQGRLEHPSIVPLYDIGRDAAGLPYFTMKKLSGTTLAKIFEGDRRDYPLNRLLRAFVDVCLAVEFAHVRGVIHRDLKPDNIVLGDYGEVSVLDWGVAKVIGEADSEFYDVSSTFTRSSGSLDDSGIQSSSDEPGPHETMPGSVVGTPGYMAPEQVRLDPDIDGRADVYSLGCVLFEILAGQMLHPTGKEGLESAEMGIEARPSKRTPHRVIPPELDDLVVQATALNRKLRPSARELSERVQAFLDGDRDVEARQKLAAAHLVRAQAAFAAGDAERAVAMREAASAIALDPKLTAAAELVGRLMLEPPREIPPEVEVEIRKDEAATMQTNARAGIRGYVMFLLMTPLIWWVAPQGSPWVLALSATTILNLALAYWGTKTNPLGKEWMLGVANALTLACIAHMYTPFLIAPGLAAMSIMGILFQPSYHRLSKPDAVVAITLLGSLGPWALQFVGILPRTTFVSSDGVVTLKAYAIAGSEDAVHIVAATYIIALLVLSATLAYQMRQRERQSKRALLLQTWQLRQLVRPAT